MNINSYVFIFEKYKLNNWENKIMFQCRKPGVQEKITSYNDRGLVIRKSNLLNGGSDWKESIQKHLLRCVIG